MQVFYKCVNVIIEKRSLGNYNIYTLYSRFVSMSRNHSHAVTKRHMLLQNLHAVIKQLQGGQESHSRPLCTYTYMLINLTYGTVIET